MHPTWTPGRDRWLWPVTLELASQRQIYFYEGGNETLRVAEVPAGTYYVYSGTPIAGYPSLLNTAINLMTQVSLAEGTGTTFTLERATPSRSVKQLHAGLRIKGSKPWRFRAIFGVSTRPLVIECMGFSKTSGFIDSTGPSNAITAPYTLRGEWVTPDCAIFKPRDVERIGQMSTQYVEREDAYLVNRGLRTTRLFDYDYIQASHLERGRAHDPLHAQTGELAHEDDFNTLEDLWRYGLSLGKPVLVIHSRPDEPLALTIPNDRWEALVCQSESQRARLNACRTLMNVGGEFYTVSLDMARRTGTYDG